MAGTDGRIHWAKYPTRCLSASGHVSLAGSVAVLLPCEDGWSDQQFSFPSEDVLRVRLASHPNLCLGTAGHSTVDGALVQFVECDSDDTDQAFVWELVRGAAPAPRPVAAAPVPAPSPYSSPYPSPQVTSPLAVPPTTPPPPPPPPTTLPPTTTLPPATTPSPTTSLKYDCRHGDWHWGHGWSLSKRAWCCRHDGVGCPSTKAPLESNYDCSEGLSDWERSWSPSKRAWCCGAPGRGCPTSTTKKPDGYDCTIWWPKEQDKWPREKRAWCCKQPGNSDIRCPSSEGAAGDEEHDEASDAAEVERAGATKRTYDCDLGWRQLWSHNQAAWCCFHLERGCPTTTSGQPTLSVEVVIAHSPHGHAAAEESKSEYNCLVTYANREKWWTPEKRQWCCKHHRWAEHLVAPRSSVYHKVRQRPNTQTRTSWTSSSREPRHCTHREHLACSQPRPSPLP
jgi:hypothetical protein